MDIISDNINFESIPDNLNKVEEFIEDVCTKYDVAPDVFGNVLVSLR